MNKMRRSKTFILFLAFAAASGLSASASAFEIDNQQMGQLLGGVVGGALGSSIGGGSGKTAATIGGALLGAYYGGKLGANYNTAPQYGNAATPSWESAPSPYAAAPAQPYASVPTQSYASAPVADADDPSTGRQAQIEYRVRSLDRRIDDAQRDGDLEAWQVKRYHHQVAYVRFNERHALHDYGYLSAASQADLNRQLDRINARLQNDLTVAWQ
jgi:hypothetical protein